ncbi:MAG: type II secretion system protein [Micavibrio aeruginosavorus]|uniref:Type II secretion system protein n=1 Tax=Micavibrio aeruginosavorus TaxID=349221 RepID=A0A7T5R156_9BACT|nr:MAG: type II secretion system protein [Micavibrio aeruginosavorus]
MATETNKPNRAAGFTLIEIALALIVVGVLMVPALQLYNINHKKESRLETTGNIENVIESALAKYLTRYGRYPAPADPSIAIGDAGSGQEVVTPIVLACSALVTSACVTNSGSIDTSADGDVVADDVYIGDIPYAALGIPYQATIDGYGYKMKYAVSAYLTNTATYGNSWGAIEVLNDQRKIAPPPATPSIYPIGAPKAHYVVVSHGQDGRGAFNTNGTRTVPCGTAASGLDFENCDNDAVFRNNIYQYDPGTATPTNAPQMNFVTGSNYFHDFIGETNKVSGDIWADIPNQRSINSTQNGNVHVGALNSAMQLTCTQKSCFPVSKFNVTGLSTGVTPAPETIDGSTTGNARADGAVKTTRICNTGSPLVGATAVGRDCNNIFFGDIPQGWFVPATIAGTPPVLSEADIRWDAANKYHKGAGIRCVNGRGLAGIVNYDERCLDTVRISNPNDLGDCVAGTYAVGITAGGALICE